MLETISCGVASVARDCPACRKVPDRFRPIRYEAPRGREIRLALGGDGNGERLRSASSGSAARTARISRCVSLLKAPSLLCRSGRSGLQVSGGHSFVSGFSSIKGLISAG
jgi:hypothetical protein